MSDDAVALESDSSVKIVLKWLFVSEKFEIVKNENQIKRKSWT